MIPRLLNKNHQMFRQILEEFFAKDIVDITDVQIKATAEALAEYLIENKDKICTARDPLGSSRVCYLDKDHNTDHRGEAYRSSHRGFKRTDVAAVEEVTSEVMCNYKFRDGSKCKYKADGHIFHYKDL